MSEWILQTRQSRNQPHAVAVKERLISTPKVLLEGCRLDRGPETRLGRPGRRRGKRRERPAVAVRQAGLTRREIGNLSS